MNYHDYKKLVGDDVAELIGKKACQPILFIGAGFARRYAGAPNWEELRASPLLDHAGFTRQLEQHYWQAWCDLPRQA